MEMNKTYTQNPLETKKALKTDIVCYKANDILISVLDGERIVNFVIADTA